MEPNLSDHLMSATLTNGADEIAIKDGAQHLWCAALDSLSRHIPPGSYAKMDEPSILHSALSVALQALIQASKMREGGAIIHAMGVACGARLKGGSQEDLVELLQVFADGLTGGWEIVDSADAHSGPLQ